MAGSIEVEAGSVEAATRAVPAGKAAALRTVSAAGGSSGVAGSRDAEDEARGRGSARMLGGALRSSLVTAARV